MKVRVKVFTKDDYAETTQEYMCSDWPDIMSDLVILYAEKNLRRTFLLSKDIIKVEALAEWPLFSILPCKDREDIVIGFK